MKNKVLARQTALKKLIKDYPVEDQITLVQLMKEKYNIDTNQSIISRDLRKLGVSKQIVDSKSIYELKTVDASAEILKLAIVKVEYNEALIVITTIPGLADFVGDFLDAYPNSGLLGTIAGETMVFAAPKSIKNIQQAYQKICNLLQVKQGKKYHEY